MSMHGSSIINDCFDIIHARASFGTNSKSMATYIKCMHVHVLYMTIMLQTIIILNIILFLLTCFVALYYNTIPYLNSCIIIILLLCLLLCVFYLAKYTT